MVRRMRLPIRRFRNRRNMPRPSSISPMPKAHVLRHRNMLRQWSVSQWRSMAKSRNAKLSRSNAKPHRSNVKLSRNNVKLSRSNVKLSRSNVKLSRSNAKLSRIRLKNVGAATRRNSNEAVSIKHAI